MTPLPGIGGSLLPGRYLIDGLDAAIAAGVPHQEQHRRVRAWWRRVDAECGPATGLRALFDVGAMPLFALLGFRARTAHFGSDAVQVQLETPGAEVVALVVLPWARRPTARWRLLAEAARRTGARWTFALAPPFLSLVAARGHATRRSLDFTLPDALDVRSIDRFLLLASAAAFDAGAGGGPAIDRIVVQASSWQDRVRADLQGGVVEALHALAPVLGESRARFDESLTLIYRMLFLLFAESRDLVPRHHSIYGRAYSVTALCRDAVSLSAGLRDRSSRIGRGLWEGLAAITRLSRAGCRIDDLIVRPFNGRLFSRASAPTLERRGPAPLARRIADRDAALARALAAIGTRRGRAGREGIAYADLGVEQLGAVYERVLDLDPDEIRTGILTTRGGQRSHGHSTRRKQSGTFYTPQPLAEFVVRRTLAPLVHGASADEILALRVVDPAMGSGAFLVAACRFLARAYERALVDEGRCAETDLDETEHARHRRLIAERCLAGVDLNPVAVQLARLSLWLTTLAHGKPLNFLDHRLRVGNSLIGAGPDDLWRGGDSPRGRRSPDRGQSLFDDLQLEASIRQAARPLLAMIERPDDTVTDVRAKEAVWARLSGLRSPLDSWRVACSLWCARLIRDRPRIDSGSDAHAWPSAPELRAAVDALVRGDRTISAVHLERWIAAARDAAARHSMFHWPLEFADVFFDDSGRPRARGGFDAVIGNPPWEMLRNDGPAHQAAGSTILPRTDAQQPLLQFIRSSGLYESCGRGHVNLYQPFLERSLSIVRSGGRIGLILPWGLASDDGASELRGRLLDRCGQMTLVGLDNAAGLFPIHRGLRFVALSATRDVPADAIRARFGVRTSEEIEALPDLDDPVESEAALDAPALDVSVDVETIRTIGGPARRIPDLRRRDDLDWLHRICRTFPAVGSERGWHARFGRELNATDDRDSFGREGLPVIEGKHIAPFVVDACGSSRYITRETARTLLPARRFEHARLGYRDVSGAGNRLSLIAAIVPSGVVTTHTIFCLRSEIPPLQQHFLCGLFNSYVLNAVVRMLMGAHVTTSLVESLPAPVWTADAAQRRIARLARLLGRRPDDRRAHAALQAGVARLYGFDAATFPSLLESFPLVPREDRAAAVAALAPHS